MISMNSPRILVCCPTHEVKSYCINDWLRSVLMLNYNNFDIFLSDNSKTPNFSKFLSSLGFKCVWNNPLGKNNFEAMRDSHNDCLNYFLKNNFDYMLHLECDVFPDESLIENLLSHNKQVISGIYHIGNGNKSQILAQKVLVNDMYGFETGNINCETDLLFLDGNLKQVFSAGIGCILIHKTVFDKIKFRTEKGKNLHPDTFFCIDLFKNKIPFYVDTSIICEHKNIDWSTLIL